MSVYLHNNGDCDPRWCKLCEAEDAYTEEEES